jgi:transcription antitermination factor NusA-like protein
MARIIAFDLCPKRRIHANYGEEAQCYSDNNFAECKEIKNVVDKLINAGYRKIPENAVVLTDKELNEELDTIKCVMIVHDDDGERYVSFDDYKEFTDRLGKIVRQRKVRIEQLEKLLDDRCDCCIEGERKETAEKFARLVEFHSVSTRDEEGREIFTISALGLKEILHEEFGIPYDEIAKEITGEKYVECHKCKYKCDCERTYLQGCMDGEEWEE